MTLRGYSLPRTPSGRASLVPAPPWSYVGDFLVIDYWADPAKAGSLLPPGLEPHPDPGRCAAIFVDWQSCSSDGEDLLDPARSQYREFFVVVNALLDGEKVTTCPFIWVDQDFALARGWIQGFPKKLGEITSNRSREPTRRPPMKCSVETATPATSTVGPLTVVAIYSSRIVSRSSIVYANVRR